MAYHYNPVRYNTYDQGLSFEENVKAKAVITVDQLNAMEEALKLASADVAIGEVSVVDNPEDANAVCEFDKAQGTHFIHLAIPKGDKGDKGDQGEQGPAGPKGDTGAQGPAGAAATITIGKVTSGGTASVTNSGTETAAVFDIVLPKGDKGDKGDQGIQGIQGEQGPEGAQGQQGPKGDQGEKGEKGDKGDQGEQGPAGTDGADGAKGDKGDQGEKGVGMYFASAEPSANQIALTAISPAGIKQNDFVLTAGGSLYAVTAVDGTNATVGASALASLKGADGAEGAKGDKGDQGDPGVGLTGEATAITAIAEPASAQAQEIATKVNEIIAALQARGVCL